MCWRKKKKENKKEVKLTPVREKVYLIKRVFVSESAVESCVDVYGTEELRDEAWNRLVHSHNNMMIDAHGLDLNHINYEEWYYNWDDQSLVCYDEQDPDAEGYYFEKDWEFIQEEE